ncbi:MAG: ABC transporter permease [Desulfobacula sp.]|uniref:ABC transporter permease n=1 Tax=Desulfobacula sp. TaxID=2593537 RepID=UPI0025BFA6BD|nr:ABC transporter permease [Desulfobacula sp.]MCD4718815.1 ABC transporter permease [Desulfobacula sp.]
MKLINKKKEIRRLDLAGYWQLVWWRFRRHKMAMIGGSILSLFLIITAFCEILSPYGPQTRNSQYSQGKPMGIHFVDKDWNFHIRPFAYGRINKRDPVTFKLTSEVDTNVYWPIKFFVRGASYKLWGVFNTNIHLFGTESGFVHLFGTDQLGRDVFSRILYATRISLSVGAVGVFFAFVLGLTMGGIAGYMGGLVDELIMRLIEFIRSIPTLPLWLAMAAALPREWSSLKVYVAVTIILACIGWTNLARRVRSKLLSMREEEFILAAKLSGCSVQRIIIRHMLPSFLSYLIVDLTISFPYIILAETSLSFLGLGLREPIVSWGVLLFSAQNVRSIIHMPWLLLPSLFVVIAVLAFNFLGDGLRDAADPLAK